LIPIGRLWSAHYLVECSDTPLGGLTRNANTDPRRTNDLDLDCSGRSRDLPGRTVVGHRLMAAQLDLEDSGWWQVSRRLQEASDKYDNSSNVLADYVVSGPNRLYPRVHVSDHLQPV
jgi:hypothetical protein